jgi:hypothetical protein
LHPLEQEVVVIVAEAEDGVKEEIDAAEPFLELAILYEDE